METLDFSRDMHNIAPSWHRVICFQQQEATEEIRSWLAMEQNWRAGLGQGSRNKIVCRIMDMLQSHTPLSGEDGVTELWNIANRFEEKIFYAASDQHDYLNRISQKMPNLETRTHNAPNGFIRSRLAMEQNWRAGLPQDLRNRIVNNIMDTLQRHTPLSGQDGMSELWKIANRFEEKIFYTASDQHDYLRKISLKMLNLEARTQNASNGTNTCNNKL